MKFLISVALVVGLSGCGVYYKQKLEKKLEARIGQPINQLIVETRIPDKTLDLGNGKVMYQWDRCSGSGDTDSQGKFSSSYSCSHLVAVTNNGIIESLKYK